MTFLTVWQGHYSSFLSASAVTKFQGEPPQWQLNYTSLGEFCRYRLLSRKRYEIGPWLQWSFGVSTMTLSNLERQGVRGQIFLINLHNYGWTVWPRMTKFGTEIQVGRSMFLMISPAHPKGCSSCVLKFLGPLNMANWFGL